MLLKEHHAICLTQSYLLFNKYNMESIFFSWFSVYVPFYTSIKTWTTNKTRIITKKKLK